MDWAEVTLFVLILARMSGFVVFNPLFGRQSVPGTVKGGFIILLDGWQLLVSTLVRTVN